MSKELTEFNPSSPPDPYHTCYILSGLSIAQHHAFHRGSAASPFPQPASLSSPFAWDAVPAVRPSSTASDLDPGPSDVVFEDADRLQPLNPVFSIPQEAATAMREWCARRPFAIVEEEG